MKKDLIGLPIETYEVLIGNILSDLTKLGIDVGSFELDHMGYQSNSTQDYEQLQSKFSEFGTLVDENVVGGRRVALFKFNEPLQYQQYIIPAVEVVEPKVGQICPSALDHVEFVIGCSFTDFMAKYPNVAWDTSALDQPKFPLLKLKLSNDTQVKFHLVPVLKIVSKN